MSKREIYPNAPISLVVAEIRHPILSEFTAVEIGAFKTALTSVLPVMRWERIVDVELPAGTQHVTNVPRFVSRDLHQSLQLQPGAMIIESTVYTGWTDFRQLIHEALQIQSRIKPFEGVDRLGLRYIDEIRIPNEVNEIKWSEWVHSDLLGPQHIEETLGAPITQSQGATITQISPSISYTTRYGADFGQAVVSTDNLVRSDESSGAYFLLDLDGAWVPPHRSVPEFDRATVLNIFDELHAPIASLFEALITEKLRNEVLR